jgi:hypothetical protein
MACVQLTQHFDEFCEGKHPLYRGFVMDGSDGQPDYRVYRPTAALALPTLFYRLTFIWVAGVAP